MKIFHVAAWIFAVAGPSFLFGGNLTTGLVAEYRFDGNLSDSSGHNLNLNPGGTFSYVVDRNGDPNGAVKLVTAASNGTFFLGIGPDLANRSSSVSLWVREDQGPGDFVGSWIFGLGHLAGIGGSEGQDMHISLGGGVVRYAFFYNELDVPTDLSPFAWHNIAATFDYGTGSRSLYLDGSLLASDTTTVPFSGETNLKVGLQGVSLDDFRFYDRSLSPNEVKALAQVPELASTGIYLGLVVASMIVLRHIRLRHAPAVCRLD